MKEYQIYSPSGELIKTVKAEGIYNYGEFQKLRDDEGEPVAVVPKDWCVIEK